MSARTATPLLRAFFAGREHDDTRLNAVLEQMPAATLLVAQRSGAVLAANSKVAALTGWTRDELARLLLAEVIAATDALEAIHTLEAGHARQLLAVPLRTHAGRPAPVDLKLAAFLEPGQHETLVLVQALPAEERAAQERQAAQQAQALDSFEQMLRMLAEPDEAALGLAIDLTRDMLAADAAGLYQVAPDQPGLRLYTPPGAARVFPAALGPSEAQYLQLPQRWAAAQRPAGYLQQAARNAGWGMLLSHPVGSGAGVVGSLCVAYRPGVEAPAEAQRLLAIAAHFVHQLTAQFGRQAALDQARDQAQRLSSQLAAVHAQVEDGVVLLDRAGRLEDLNAAAARMLGYRPSEVKGRPFRDVLFGDAAVSILVERCLEGSLETDTRDCRLFRRSGDACFATLQVRALPQGGCVLTLRDVTAVKDKELEREHLDQLAYLGQATHSFAHEVRHPLNNVSTGVQYLAMRLGQTDEETTRVITTIQAECERISHMMTDMLGWAKPLQANLAPTDMDAFIRRVLNRFRVKLERGRVCLTLTVSPGLPSVLADERLLQQVFENLVENAIQAMPAGGDLMVALSASQRATGQVVEVKVGDSGPGIPDEARRRLFDPYFTTKANGTGLGLAISKRLVTLHHGAIAVESFPGTGTIFTVTLPAHSAAPSEAPS
jgi:PAS domain S-box-containing protein